VCSIALPFALGALLALALYPHHRDVNGEDVPFTAFALFIGVAMSITAFPVLARLLSERGLQRTPVGVLSLACAAVDDVLAWSLLAIVVAVRIGGSLTGVVQILAMTAIFALIMLLVVRPLLTRMVPRYQRAGALTPDIFAVVLAGLLVSAWATDQIGVHAIFGAFVFGAIMPRRDASGLIREILERLEQVSLLLLLPVFFVVTGLQVNVGAVGPAGLWQLGLILLVAVGGKFLGAATAARIQRVPRRQAAAVGVLMNTRGLTELVILQVGAQLGVLDQSLFTLLVIMALVTTGMTAPLLRLVYPDRVLLREIAAAERAELSEPESYTVLVWVTDPVHDGPLVQLALDFLGREEPARLVLCQFLPQPKFKLEVASGLGAELGAIASAGDALRALARQTQSPDVTSTVVARFSADPLEDIATLAETAHANVLVTRNSNEFPTPGTWAMATADPVQHLSLGAVAVVTDGAADGRACVRLGAALAMRSGSTLTIGGGEGRGAARRASVAAAVLRRRGIPAVAADNEFLSASSVMLLPQHLASSVENLAEHPTVVRVRAGTEDIDDDLETAVARIAVPAVPTVPDYREPDGDSKTKLR
jgi:Kef-type K+ transport system membrane component KefB